MKTVAVTGATGYVGTAFVRRLLETGARVRALGRSDPGTRSVDFISYDLRASLREGDLANIDAVVHLAAQTNQGAAIDEEVEVLAVRRLVEATKGVGARFVFASSQTARPDAPTSYGRAKWRCEQIVLAAGGVVVRPGLVYGGAERGLFGTLCRLTRSLPVLPHFRPDPPIQPIHVDDLAEALTRCALRDAIAGGVVYNLGEQEPIGFSVFLRMLSEQRAVRPGFRVPVPIAFLARLLCLPLLPGRLSAHGVRLRSLTGLPPMTTTGSLLALGLTLRPIRDGLARSGLGNRRSLIAEAVTLLRYVLRGKPSLLSLKRYVRAVELGFEGRPLLFRPSVRRWPYLLVLTDQPATRSRTGDLEFWRRMDLATVVAESSPAHAARFLAFDERRFWAQLTVLMLHLAAEGLCRAVCLALRRQADGLTPDIEPAGR